jgi:heterokaryon incompatibility protein (HET)
LKPEFWQVDSRAIGLLNMANIQYQPLDRSKREIRLIVLSDAEDTKSGSSLVNESLKCDLIATSLDLYKEPLRNSPAHGVNVLRNALARTFLKNQPYSREFYALSYVWGDPAAICDIEINGNLVKIGASLHAALSSIRRNTEFRVIWADALCINQIDNIEKSWQVQQMAAIYSRAQATISWLGPSSGDSNLALATLIDLAKKTRFHWSIQEATEGGLPPSSVTKNVLQVVKDSRSWDAIVDICSRPYWSRIWIFQEMACAPNKYFLCGDSFAKDIDRPISLLLAWLATGREVQGKSLGSHCFSMIDSLQTFRFHGNFPSDAPYYIRPGTLHDMLTKLNSLNATNQRDMIYAPLGIATDKEGLSLVPDYSKDLDIIFKETACALLRTGRLEVLLSASFQDKKLQLPSWVPDWSSLFDTIPSRLLYRAHDSRSQRSETLNKIPRYSNNLTLDGYFVGRITKMCNSCPTSALEYTEVGSANAVTFSGWLNEVEDTIFPNREDASDGNLRIKDRASGAATAELLSAAGGQRPVWSFFPDPYLQAYQALKSAKSLGSLIADLNNKAPRKQNPELLNYVKGVLHNLKTGSRPYRTDSGEIGLTWKDKDNIGDVIVVIPGVSMPCVLRRYSPGNTSTVAQTSDHYKLVGATYVHGIMWGEFFNKECAHDVRTFTLF